MKTINKVITEPYKHLGKLKSKISNGFATVSQKSTLVKLRVLQDADLSMDANIFNIKKGQFVFVSEETLHSSVWAKTKLTLENSSDEFIIIDPVYIVGVE